ncbi:MAG: hypothetical protein MI747_06580 [Desulfobacterales bacterium]|nr:hypothetical protein [Desulfobacterales bacterium]
MAFEIKHRDFGGRAQGPVQAEPAEPHFNPAPAAMCPHLFLSLSREPESMNMDPDYRLLGWDF